MSNIYRLSGPGACNGFARDLVEFFLRLSNEPFKVPKKAVMTIAVEPLRGNKDRLQVRIGTYGRSDALSDMDRIFVTLDGKQHQPSRLESGINAQFQDSGNVFEDEYFHIKGYKNGNIHIKFKRDDLLHKAKKVISDYYQGHWS